MRRAGLLLAGALLATGTGLALASPASAAGSTDTDSAGTSHSCRWIHHHHTWWDNDWDNNWDNDWNDNWRGHHDRRCYRWIHRHGHGHH